MEALQKLPRWWYPFGRRTVKTWNCSCQGPIKKPGSGWGLEHVGVVSLSMDGGGWHQGKYCTIADLGGQVEKGRCLEWVHCHDWDNGQWGLYLGSALSFCRPRDSCQKMRHQIHDGRVWEILRASGVSALRSLASSWNGPNSAPIITQLVDGGRSQGESSARQRSEGGNGILDLGVDVGAGAQAGSGPLGQAPMHGLPVTGSVRP